jgi:putative membrane protein
MFDSLERLMHSINEPRVQNGLRGFNRAAVFSPAAGAPAAARDGARRGTRPRPRSTLHGVSLLPPTATLLSLENLIQLAPTLALGSLYARRAQTLSSSAHPVPAWRQVCFYGGLATILIALFSPIGELSDELLYAHMVEHLLMGDVAALLIVLGLTGPLLAPLLRIRLFDRLRALSNPLVAFPLWAIDMYVWHLPVLYQAALRHLAVHALQHTMFIAIGINMWLCLFGPLPTARWFGNIGRLLYILAVRLTGGVLGNIFLWSGTVFYPFYAHPDAAHRIASLTDQRMAGGIMMTEESILTLCLFCWLFLRAARESEERQELLDFAEDHGIELSEERAARAVSAGRAADLRRRLERSVP